MAKPYTMESQDQTIRDAELLAKELGQDDFDLMLVGDGSGNFVSTPAGWFVTAYERKTGKVWEHFGATNGGTNNLAELEPYVHALASYRHVLWSYHVTTHGNDVDRTVVCPPRVLIVSDSEVTVRCGQGVYSRRANSSLWASIEWFERKGYRLTWVHVPRNSNRLSARADKYAGEARVSIANVGKQILYGKENERKET